MPVRDIFLPDKVGFVDVATYPPETECYWTCLTNQEIHAIRAHLFPFAKWPTRFVHFIRQEHRDIDGSICRTVDDPTFAAYLAVIDQLDLKLGGCSMSCADLKTSLDTIAAAIIAGPSGGGCVVNVACPTGTATLSNALAGIPDNEWGPPAAEPAPTEGVPPAGFETWAVYRTYKCHAAQAIWDTLYRTSVMLEGLTGLSSSAALMVPLVAQFFITSLIVMPLAALAELVAAVIAVAALEAGAMYAFSQVAGYLLTNKQAIICELYDSGDAAAAYQAVNNRLEDAVQSIEWGEVLGPVAGSLAPLFGTILGATENNSLVNPLFKLSLAVSYAGDACPCSQAPSSRYWHFTQDAEGWQFAVQVGDEGYTHGWANPGANGACPDEGEDPGQLQDYHGVQTAFCQVHWYLNLPEGYLPVATAGMAFQFRGALTDVNSALVAEIVYEDDTVDSGYLTPNNPGWNTVISYVSSGSVGKAIKQLSIMHNLGANGPAAYFAADNVRLVAA